MIVSASLDASWTMLHAQVQIYIYIVLSTEDSSSIQQLTSASLAWIKSLVHHALRLSRCTTGSYPSYHPSPRHDLHRNTMYLALRLLSNSYRINRPSSRANMVPILYFDQRDHRHV